MGWLLLRRFVDLVGVYCLLVSSRNHSSTFLLIDLQKTKLIQSKILKKAIISNIKLLTDFERLSTTWCLSQKYSNKNVAKFLRTPFLENTFGWLLLKLVEYLFLEAFVSLDKSILFRCRCLILKVLEILIYAGVEKIFSCIWSDLTWNPF